MERRGTAPLDRYFELIPITSAIKDDPDAADVINEWEERLSREMDDPGRLDARPARRRREARIRASETNLGDLFADAIRQEVQADVAIVNSGALRGNRVYPAGLITRRTLVQMHPFSNVVCKIEVSGRTLLAGAQPRRRRSFRPRRARSCRCPACASTSSSPHRWVSAFET